MGVLLESHEKFCHVQRFFLILQKECLLAWRHRAQMVQPVLFFTVIVLLFVLAIGASPQTLQLIAPAAIWIAGLLSVVLSLDTLFREDHEDGSLEQWLLLPYALPKIILAKVFAHWLTAGLPLVLLTPFIALILDAPPVTIPALMATVLLGMPILSMMGAFGVALVVGLKGGGILLALLLVPFYIPVLIFGTTAGSAALQGFSVLPHLAILGAIFIFTFCTMPFATAVGLRISCE